MNARLPTTRAPSYRRAVSLPGSASSFGQLDREARIWLGLTALLHLVAVFRWPGYLHPDEHFQTLELASYALGHTPADALPWEFEARIRPWFQPGLYALVGLVVPPDRPFAFATACRGLSALIAWLSVLALGTRYRAWFPDAATRRFAWAATATFYVLPVLRVRTSSENLGAALFVLGLALAVSRATELEQTSSQAFLPGSASSPATRWASWSSASWRGA